MRLKPDTQNPVPDQQVSQQTSRRTSQQTSASYAEMPPSFLREENWLAGRALQAWRRSQRSAVPGFEATSLTIVDPGGEVLVLQVAPAIAAPFDLTPGQSLAFSPPRCENGEHGITAELRGACDLVALGGSPILFEASLIGPDRSVILVRGIVLPLMPRGLASDVETVQIVLSWREVLNRSATTRLRRELGDALRAVASQRGDTQDPFPINSRS